MCGGALALLEGSLSRGCCLQCSVLLALGGVLPNLKLELSHKEPKQQTDPRSCARVVYIAGDTLRHQPMGMGHMTVLQFRGPITFCVLQWCHPMLTRTLWRTSYSTRMIALYGDRKRIQARAGGMSPVMTTSCTNRTVSMSRGWLCPEGCVCPGEGAPMVYPTPVLTPSGRHQNMHGWQVGGTNPTRMFSCT